MSRHTAKGKVAMSVVTPYAETPFSGSRVPTRDQFEAMYRAAHAVYEAYEAHFIASSVNTEKRCEPVTRTA